MEPDGAERLVREVARMLALPYDEAYKMLRGAFDAGSPQDALVDMLGCENIELVSALVQSADFFAEHEETNDEPKYVEHVLPPGKTVSVGEESLVPTSEAGPDARHFPYRMFNAVQSRVFPCAYRSDDNMLVCAPTGAGKTDVALLAMLRSLRDPHGRAVYVVPMKALATEIARKYAAAFAGTGTSVIEYTGDTELEPRIAAGARVIVCTPEKFDVSTRRHSPIFRNIRLLVIDEIHLLGDSRGPVLEILVARMFRMSELGQRMIRIVGLSATLPNFRDVARFIRAKGVFCFDAMYRPVPLAITVTGFKKGSRPSDEEAYLVSRIAQFRSRAQQALVFVHSRARTVTVGKVLAAALAERGAAGSRGRRPAERRRGTGLPGALDALVQHGIGVHHAGLSRAERHAMEGLFGSGAIDVLVCTSTLAWGVNMPAHAVVIYGTTFYNPVRGAFDDLGILDVVQIFGRAGRPQYDTAGEAVLITQASKLDAYLSMLRGSKDIESRLLYRATDAMCAEIYLANITSVSSALLWMKSTFLYVRMQRNPAMYGLSPDGDVAARVAGMRVRDGHAGRTVLGVDEHALADYVLLALRRLESCGLVKVNRRVEDDHNTWLFEATPFGRVASLHYLSHLTMHRWLEGLGACADDAAALLLLLLRSEEFAEVALRESELPHLAEMHGRLLLSRDIDTEFEASVECKLTVLLSAHFVYLRPTVFSLACDTDFVVDTLERMLSALKEILLCLRRYEVYRTVLLLEQRVRRERPREGLPYTHRARRCGRFVDLAVELARVPCTAGDGRRPARGCALLLYQGSVLVYAAEFSGHFRNYIFCPGSADSLEVHHVGLWRRVAVECTSDLSMAGLYYYGIHCCGPVFALAGVQDSCPHFVPAHAADGRRARRLDRRSAEVTFGNVVDVSYVLSIRFVAVDVPAARERLKVMDSKIYKTPGSVLVVCSDSAKEVAAELNTRLALENNFADMFEHAACGGTQRRRIARLPEARRICGDFECVVFRGCSDGSSYYPAHEILGLCSGRDAVIYECEEFVAYFKALTGGLAA